MSTRHLFLLVFRLCASAQSGFGAGLDIGAGAGVVSYLKSCCGIVYQIEKEGKVKTSSIQAKEPKLPSPPRNPSYWDAVEEPGLRGTLKRGAKRKPPNPLHQTRCIIYIYNIYDIYILDIRFKKDHEINYLRYILIIPASRISHDCSQQARMGPPPENKAQPFPLHRPPTPPPQALHQHRPPPPRQHPSPVLH